MSFESNSKLITHNAKFTRSSPLTATLFVAGFWHGMIIVTQGGRHAIAVSWDGPLPGRVHVGRRSSRAGLADQTTARAARPASLCSPPGSAHDQRSGAAARAGNHVSRCRIRAVATTRRSYAPRVVRRRSNRTRAGDDTADYRDPDSPGQH